MEVVTAPLIESWCARNRGTEGRENKQICIGTNGIWSLSNAFSDKLRGEVTALRRSSVSTQSDAKSCAESSCFQMSPQGSVGPPKSYADNPDPEFLSGVHDNPSPRP